MNYDNLKLHLRNVFINYYRKAIIVSFTKNKFIYFINSVETVPSSNTNLKFVLKVLMFSKIERCQFIHIDGNDLFLRFSVLEKNVLYKIYIKCLYRMFCTDKIRNEYS